MLISKSGCNPKNYFKLPGYLLYDVHHPNHKAHGASTVLLKTNIIHLREDVSLKVYDKFGPLTVSVIHLTPKNKSTN